ncbi:MAG: hydrogenase nickel incorporation protein HypB, partial [Candidatus Auribacterota bacterium]|nr:hydrogenase nickel incorporation protein HypB [Candidatus Auribacterota bacterium]
MKVAIKEDILKEEDRIGRESRKFLKAHGVTAYNLIGSPGSGKTSLIEAAHGYLKGKVALGVIEGDLASDKDTVRLRRLGLEALQINTGRGCHLSPAMVEKALKEMPLDNIDILIIENVGNLVCPVSFDLGEDAKIGLVSVAEGDDKPTKYPLLFREASVVILNKIDLIPYCDFSREDFYRGLREINPNLPVIEVSCRSGEGVEEWGRWLV